MFNSQGNVNDSTFRVVHKELIKADLQIKALIQDLSKFTGYSQLNLHSLNSSISENMRKMKLAIDELDTLAREQIKETDKRQLLKEVEKQQKQYAANQSALRKANLACQALLEKQTKEELLEGGAPITTKRRRTVRADKESISKQSAEITQQLNSITGSLLSQVAQSQESLKVLVGSSAAVSETQEEFRTMGGILAQSRSLLRKYGRREVTDRVLLTIAALFFVVCVVYITHKRLF